MLSSSRLSRSLALATLGLGALTAQAGEIYAMPASPGSASGTPIRSTATSPCAATS